MENPAGTIPIDDSVFGVECNHYVQGDALGVRFKDQAAAFTFGYRNLVKVQFIITYFRIVREWSKLYEFRLFQAPGLGVQFFCVHGDDFVRTRVPLGFFCPVRELCLDIVVVGEIDIVFCRRNELLLKNFLTRYVTAEFAWSMYSRSVVAAIKKYHFH